MANTLYRIRIHISYDGTNYSGWQKQNSGVDTIQNKLEAALSRVMNTPIKTMASGRTDAGVHAALQVVHADVPRLPDANLKRSLNSLTPSSIVVRDIFQAPKDFHSIADCVSKTYEYLILNQPDPSAFRANFTLWEPRQLDLTKLNAMAEVLLGTHDFKSFQTAGTEVKTTIRDISYAKWSKEAHNLVKFRISGSGFLKQMVRNLVGTQLYLLHSKANYLEFNRILESCDRKEAKTSAPAGGLYLVAPAYPSELDNKCRKI